MKLYIDVHTKSGAKIQLSKEERIALERKAEEILEGGNTKESLRKRRRMIMGARRWGQDEQKMIESMAHNGATAQDIKSIAVSLGRTPGAVYTRLRSFKKTNQLTA